MSLSKARDLRAERQNTAERMREIIDAPQGENELLSSEQETEFDRLHERQNELGTEIDTIEEAEARHLNRLEQVTDVEGDLGESTGVRAGRQDSDDLEQRNEPTEARKAYDAVMDVYLRYGVAELDGEQRKLLRSGYSTNAGVEQAETRVQSVGEGVKGGFLVPEGVMQAVTPAQLQFGGMRRTRAQVIVTSDGRDIPWPTYDDTSNQGRLIQENAARSTTDVAFGQAVLHAYGYSSDFIKVPWELLQDSEFDIASMIGSIAGERISRITNVHFTTGDGSSKPFGVVGMASTGVTAAATDEFTYDELIDLKHSVDPAYRLSAQWMFNDAGIVIAKKLKDGNGLPLWQAGMASKEPNTIDGDPYVVNQQLDAFTTGNSVVLYGDFSLYKIRDVSGMQLRRLEERFADSGQVAFLLFSRHDGVLVNAGTNPIKALVLA